MAVAHRLSEVDAGASIASCEVCGPGVRIRWKKHVQRWRCVVSDDRRRPDAKREQYLKAFGLTPFDYDALLLSQEGACAICADVNPNGRALAVDHCHETERVRGLLCTRCNTALGLMKDDPERLLRAIQYLA